MLAALCPLGKGVSSASITDMAPEVFRPLLCYLHAGEVSEDECKSHAREIIEAADRFEIVSLKLAAEAWCVQSTDIDLDNVVEVLICSDVKNLALLKETVMGFIVANGEELLWGSIGESLARWPKTKCQMIMPIAPLGKLGQEKWTHADDLVRFLRKICSETGPDGLCNGWRFSEISEIEIPKIAAFSPIAIYEVKNSILKNREHLVCAKKEALYELPS